MNAIEGLLNDWKAALKIMNDINSTHSYRQCLELCIEQLERTLNK